MNAEKPDDDIQTPTRRRRAQGLGGRAQRRPMLPLLRPDGGTSESRRDTNESRGTLSKPPPRIIPAAAVTGRYAQSTQVGP